MKTHSPILTLSMTAVAALTINRMVGLDGDVCAAGAKAAGMAQVNADAGEQTPVAALGVILVEAGAAITAGSEIESDASGRAIAKTTGLGNGHAMDAALAAGDVIRVLRGI